MVYFGASDGRVALLYPFMGRVLVGSTDIPIDNPDLAVCEDAERDYMLGILREVFPGIEVVPSHVIYSYCGVRPLPRADGLDPGAVSRDHSITLDRLPGTDVPVYALIGGKWTTFRGFAEEAADRVLADLGRGRRTSTTLRPIGGGRDFPTTTAELDAVLDRLATLVSRERANVLLARYGTRATSVAAWCAERQDAPLTSLADYSREEIAFIFTHELVGRLADVLFRRTDIALSGRLTAEVAIEVAGIGGRAAGWTAERQAVELAEVDDVARRQHGVALDIHRSDLRNLAAIQKNI